MNDKELLELAAKAAGIRLEWDGDPEKWVPTYYEGKTYHGWNPLTDDGDALRLAVKLKMDIEFSMEGVWVIAKNFSNQMLDRFFIHNNDCSATRRAIVRAAAEIGRGME